MLSGGDGAGRSGSEEVSEEMEWWIRSEIIQCEDDWIV